MRNVVLVVLAIAIVGTGAFSAEAQTPFVHILFNHGSEATASCPPGPVGTVFDEVAVIAFNFDMWMSAVEYSIDYGPVLAWIADNVPDGSLVIGHSPTGITIAYPIPQNAFSPLAVQTATVLWLCDDCSPWPDTAYPRVLPYPASGRVRAVRWPDNVVVDAVGMTSIICPTP